MQVNSISASGSTQASETRSPTPSLPASHTCPAALPCPALHLPCQDLPQAGWLLLADAAARAGRCVMQPDSTDDSRPDLTNFHFKLTSGGLVCVSRTPGQLIFGPTYLGWHAPRTDQQRPYPALRDQTIPDRIKHINTPTA